MEENIEFSFDHYCFGCLSSSPGLQIHDLNIKCEILKAIFQTATLRLCFICKRMAQHSENFIQNVQSNQILLENFHHREFSSTLSMVQPQVSPLISLSTNTLEDIDLTESDPEIIETTSDEAIAKETDCETKRTDVEVKRTDIEAKRRDLEVKRRDFEVKLEVKEELEQLDIGFADADDFEEALVKDEEDDFPLKDLLKEELQLSALVYSTKAMKKEKSKKKKQKYKTKDKDIMKERYKSERKVNTERFVKTIKISERQCLEERKQMEKDAKYINATFQCRDCVKGFNFKSSYDQHMELHNPSFGDYECSICKQRRETRERLISHKKSHTTRYKCADCGLTRVSRLTVKDHYNVVHSLNNIGHYNCPHCNKVYPGEVSLQKHIGYKHTHKKPERVACEYCHKTFAGKSVLRSHMVLRHPNDLSVREVSKRYICGDCGKAFRAPSHLKNHAVKHSGQKNYYCVECDKSFKSETILKHHLKTAAPHVNYLDLPLACLQCDKRFSIKRDLERHMNRVHLNIRPYPCDKCDRAYINGWSLREHKRYVHDGFKRPLKYPCTLCDKIFDRNSILKGHMRTHTGERPYQCAKCPAQFSQASVLGTHVKLIHLKQTRDGRPKPSALK